MDLKCCEFFSFNLIGNDILYTILTDFGVMNTLKKNLVSFGNQVQFYQLY